MLCSLIVSYILIYPDGHTTHVQEYTNMAGLQRINKILHGPCKPHKPCYQITGLKIERPEEPFKCPIKRIYRSPAEEAKIGC